MDIGAANGTNLLVKVQTLLFVYQYGFTALMMASTYGDPDTVKALLEANADPNIIDNVKFSDAITPTIECHS